METEKKFDVCVFGSCIVDFISYVPRLPMKGETLHGTKFETGFGGKGANQCVAATRLGSKTAMIGKLGNDNWGHEYYKHLKEEGVNVDNVEILDGYNTGIAQINVADNGDNQIVIVVGVNKKISEDDVDKARDILDNSKVLICQLETPVPPSIKAIASFDGISIVNAAPALRDMPEGLLQPPTIFCVNESEAAIISKLPVETIEDAKTALFKLKEMGCNTIIVTLGKNGAIYSMKGSDKVKHIKAQQVDNAIDTTGAGDAFIGALAHFIAKYPSIDLGKIIGAACEIATMTVQKHGTQTSFPLKEDVDIDLNTKEY